MCQIIRQATNFKHMKNIPLILLVAFGLFSRILTCCSESPVVSGESGINDTSTVDTVSSDTVKTRQAYLVSSANDIRHLPELNPGDTVLMANGTWTDQNVILRGVGTEQSPIILKPQSENGVVLSGGSTLSIAGDYLQVENLIFRDGNVAGNVIEFRRGSVFSNHCRLTRVVVEDYSPDDKSINSKWISLYGTYNRVDHCSVQGKTNIGTTLVVWLDETPDHHQIDHNYFGPRPELGENGGETIRIGTSDWVSYESNTIVEHNLFEECDGEVEIISNKSVGNRYRYNTFRNCLGTITLRHGSYCKVYGNFFLGDLAKNCGGVRIIGEGHEVYNNYFENLSGTSYRAAISLVNGEVDAENSGYVQVTKAKIGFNTIINCKQPFAIGAGKDSKKVLPPDETFIANNLVVGRSGYALVHDYDVTTGITWSANIVDVDDLGIGTEPGIVNTDLELVREGELFRPKTNSVCVGAANLAYFKEILVDIDGQNRSSSSKDVGCDQVVDGEILIYPLKKEDLN
jgi:poly(beta-D-mannuronate) lyase